MSAALKVFPISTEYSKRLLRRTRRHLRKDIWICKNEKVQSGF